MTQQQFEELKSLIQLNTQGISRNHEMTQRQFEEVKTLIQVNSQGISRNYEMIGRIYEEHGGRLTRLEVRQEQFSDDLRAVAEGVTGNAERLDRLEGRFDGLEGRFDGLEGRFDRFEVKFDRLSASVEAGFTDHEQRLRAVED